MLFNSAYLGDNEIVKAYKGNTLFYEKGGGLPSGYTAVNWIASEGGLNKSRFSVPIDFDNTKILRSIVSIPDLVATNGLYIYVATTRRGGFLVGRNSKISSVYNTTWRDTAIGIAVGTEYDIEYSTTEFLVNGVKQYDGMNVSYGTENFLTNGYASGSTTWYSSTHRFHLIQILNKADRSIIQNIVPCLDDENVPCMYDTTNQVKYANIGNGTFLYG